MVNCEFLWALTLIDSQTLILKYIWIKKSECTRWRCSCLPHLPLRLTWFYPELPESDGAESHRVPVVDVDAGPAGGRPARVVLLPVHVGDQRVSHPVPHLVTIRHLPGTSKFMLLLFFF